MRANKIKGNQVKKNRKEENKAKGKGKKVRRIFRGQSSAVAQKETSVLGRHTGRKI